MNPLLSHITRKSSRNCMLGCSDSSVPEKQKEALVKKTDHARIAHYARISVYNYNTTIYAFCIAIWQQRRKGSLNTG